MPSCYAHYRFGNRALPELPADIRKTIQRCRMLYDLGLQGPDFFLYYKLGADSPVRNLSRKYHYQSGRDVFSKICRDMKHPSEAELAYLYGLLGHYCLDSACHPAVHEIAGGDDLAHNAMESEFDRYLLERDGVKKPHTYDRGKHMACSKNCAPVVAQFYPEAEESQIREAIVTMRQVLGLLTVHFGARQVLKLMGGANPGLLMGKKADPRFGRWNGKLEQLWDGARKRYPECLHQLHCHMAYGEPLGGDFEGIFG